MSVSHTPLSATESEIVSLLATNLSSLSVDELAQLHHRLNTLGDKLQRSSTSCKCHEDLLAKLGKFKLKLKDRIAALEKESTPSAEIVPFPTSPKVAAMAATG